MRIPQRVSLVPPFLLLFGVAAVTGLERGRPDRFRQLEELLPTANAYRSASGAPGHGYWQQRADYVIDVELDDERQRILGSERITYTNHSPDELAYLWVQIDPNIFAPQSHSVLVGTAPELEEPSYDAMRSLLARADFDGSCEIHAVETLGGDPLPHVVNGTMMRIDLERPLASGASTDFRIDWSYDINDAELLRARTGYEYFEEDGNYIYELAHWFPRMAAYTDATGWQNKQFLGRGEFTLEFGDYLVRITVPDDHVVAATGTLQNPEEVLSPEQRERLERARSARTPLFVITPEEARANESSTPGGKRTWVFQARDVRDFAFASSRKFLWDAVGHEVDGRTVMAMSFWPKEGEPLWSRYSTHAIVHTLDVYSRFTFPYPYPVAISVNGPVGGMEYPMICFNGPRPEEDGTYSERSKYGLISVIIHEVGHNWFPMIVNSDERQWTWMDEGLNTFLQYLAEQEWEEDYPSWRGKPHRIVDYMSSARQVPIMTNSESILQFGNNAYAKPATALNVLRETVMGRELFDFAFQQYAQRWRFKRPMPADLFRTLEDASAVDLDWFWRGWFYTTDACDLSLDGLRRYRVDTRDPKVEKERLRAEREAEPTPIADARNAGMARRVETFPELLDFYNRFDDLDVTPEDEAEFAKLLEGLEEEQRALLSTELSFYVVDVTNVGGLVMPVILEIGYTDGSREELRIPAEIWRQYDQAVSKLIVTAKEIERLVLDPHLETADVDLANNHWPRKVEEHRIRMGERPESKNPMQIAGEREERAADEAEAQGADERAGAVEAGAATTGGAEEGGGR